MTVGAQACPSAWSRVLAWMSPRQICAATAARSGASRCCRGCSTPFWSNQRRMLRSVPSGCLARSHPAGGCHPSQGAPGRSAPGAGQNPSMSPRAAGLPRNNAGVGPDRQHVDLRARRGHRHVSSSRGIGTTWWNPHTVCAEGSSRSGPVDRPPTGRLLPLAPACHVGATASSCSLARHRAGRLHASQAPGAHRGRCSMSMRGSLRPRPSAAGH
jgi:hypothetical protein